jgi:hypothetical protein
MNSDYGSWFIQIVMKLDLSNFLKEGKGIHMNKTF